MSKLLSAFSKEVLWAFALMGGGLILSTIIGAWSGLHSPWNYTAATGVGLLVVAAAGAAFNRWRGPLPPPWGHAYDPGSRDLRAGATASAELGALVIKQGEGGPRPSSILFQLRGRKDQSREVYGQLRAIRITAPVHRIVHAAQTPKQIRWKFRPIMVVRDFPRGYLLFDELIGGNVEVRAELYYADGESGP